MMIENLTKKLIAHEGMRLFPYTDTTGHLTIGVGRNLTDIGISEDEALVLLQNDILKARKSLLSYPWFTSLDDERQSVLIEFVFNIGLKGFLNFKKMIDFIISRDFEKAAQELLNSKWATQVGKIRSSDMSRRLKDGVN